MFLTKGAVLVGLKIKEERDRKREERQGKLVIGSSEVARRAFSDDTKSIESSLTLQRTKTRPKFEGPDAVVASPTSAGVSSPSESERNAFSAMSSDAQTPASLRQRSRTNSEASRPPSYSEHTFTSYNSSGSQYLSPTDSKGSSTGPLGPTASNEAIPNGRAYSIADSDNISIITRGSKGTQALRIKTKDTHISSGFPYHPALFDLQVRPDEWERFTYQVTECTKLGATDHAKMWSAATATALTGAIGTSIWVGRTMNRTLQEKKVKSALLDMEDGGLGNTLQQWNDRYFKAKGLFAHLELSEEALRSSEQKSKTLRKHHSLNTSKEERQRIKDERKFVIVVSKLDDAGYPAEAVHELADEGVAIPELDSSMSSQVAELDGGKEMPQSFASAPGTDIKRGLYGIPEGVAELPAADVVEIDSKPVETTEKIDAKQEDSRKDSGVLPPPPLFVRTPSGTDKEYT